MFSLLLTVLLHPKAFAAWHRQTMSLGPGGVKDNLLTQYHHTNSFNPPFHLYWSRLRGPHCPGTRGVRTVSNCTQSHRLLEHSMLLPWFSQQEQCESSGHSLLRVVQRSICIGWVYLNIVRNQNRTVNSNGATVQPQHRLV